MSDKLSDLIQVAFEAVCEAEKLAYPELRTTIGANLIAAHSELLAAKNDYASMLRKHDVKTPDGAAA